MLTLFRVLPRRYLSPPRAATFAASALGRLLTASLTFFSVISTSGSIEHAESKRAQSTEKERRIFFRTNIFIIVIKKIRVFV